MKKTKIDNWIVIVGKPVFSSRTRKQARAFVKERKRLFPDGYVYIGKCIDDHSKIILDV